MRLLPLICTILRVSIFGRGQYPAPSPERQETEPFRCNSRRGLTQSSYTLAIFGIDAQGTRTEIDRRILDVHFDD